MDNAKEPEHLAIRKKRKGAPRRFRSHKRWKDVTIDDLPHAVNQFLCSFRVRLGPNTPTIRLQKSKNKERSAGLLPPSPLVARVSRRRSSLEPTANLSIKGCFTPLWRANMTAPNAAIQHFRRGKKCIDTQDREDIRILALKQQNSLCWESITSLYNLDSSRFLDKENWISKVIPNYLPGMHPAPEMPQNETFANSSDASSSGRGTLSSTPLLSPTHYDSPSDSGVDGEDAHTSGGSLHRFRLSKRVPARSGGKRKADAGHSDTIRLAKKRFFDYTTDDFGANVAAARGRRKLDQLSFNVIQYQSLNGGRLLSLPTYYLLGVYTASGSRNTFRSNSAPAATHKLVY
ncbi:hypothetical protein FRB99_004100 [Tulasnella sp. 403]|nr:hypothetical protein FRB99_004100 [Tulasnella sp. 403]